MKMYSQKDDLFNKLVEKTREVGRRLTFDEVDQDPEMPRANSYAYYYGSFDVAADEAWQKVKFSSVVQMKEEVIGMSKKVQMDEERKKMVMQELVEMYIANDGQMPTARMIKKNQYISEAEVNLLRVTGAFTEQKIRRMAEEKTGKKFATAEERRRMRPVVEAQPKPEPVAVPEVTEKQEVEKVSVEEKVRNGGRGHAVATEEVLADLKALAEKLGHVPSQIEIANAENGAKFSYPTYVKKLGPKADWTKVLGMETEVVVPEPEVAQVVAEPVTEPEVVPVEEVCDDGMETIEIPSFSIKIPKALEGKITVTITI